MIKTTKYIVIHSKWHSLIAAAARRALQSNTNSANQSHRIRTNNKRESNAGAEFANRTSKRIESNERIKRIYAHWF